MVIKVIGAGGGVKASGAGQLLYEAAYEEGDCIVIEGEGFAVIAPEDALPPAFGYLSGEYRLPVPFGSNRLCYSPKCFTGGKHFLWAREVAAHEITAYRNLALNPADNAANAGFFPHASANVETRGESAFFARNAIDGINAQKSHGDYPYQSWGIGGRGDAELRIDFGRGVATDRIVIAPRSDFPHDNWWKTVDIAFSDGFAMTLELRKSGEPQAFEFDTRITDYIIMRNMKKDETDVSLFPALNEIEVWGSYIFVAKSV